MIEAVFMMQDGLRLSLTIKDFFSKNRIWRRIRFDY